MGAPPWLAMGMKTKRLIARCAVERSSGSRRGARSSAASLRRRNAGARCAAWRRLGGGLGRSGRRCMGIEAGGWTDAGRIAALLGAWAGGQHELARARDQELDQVVAQSMVVGELVQLGARAHMRQRILDDL